MNVSLETILAYAEESYLDHLDSLGDVNLTSLEEDVQANFDLSDEEMADYDISFEMFTYLVSQGIVPRD